MPSKKKATRKKTAEDRYKIMESTRLDKDNSKRERMRGQRRAEAEMRSMLREDRWNLHHAQSPGPSSMPDESDTPKVYNSEEEVADNQDADDVDSEPLADSDGQVEYELEAEEVLAMDYETLSTFMASTITTLRLTTRQLGMIANSIDRIDNRVLEVSNSIEGLRSEIGEISAALAIVPSSRASPAKGPDRPFTHSFLPARTKDDLMKLEEMATDAEFIGHAKEWFRLRYPCAIYEGRGKTVLFRLFDDFFTRSLLTQCLWTGVTKTGAVRIEFEKFVRTLDLLFSLVKQSDPAYSSETSFEHAVKRLLQRGVRRNQLILRKPSARSKRQDNSPSD